MSSDPRAVPLVRPPALRSDETRGATRLELFFDLAYVLAVAALAANLVVDADWGGVGEFAFLLVLVWLSWVQFTLYNNRFDTDDILLRFGKFAAMAAVLGCAASMGEATGLALDPVRGQLPRRPGGARAPVCARLAARARGPRHHRRLPRGVVGRRRPLGGVPRDAGAVALRPVGSRGGRRHRGADPRDPPVADRPPASRAPAGAVRAARHPRPRRGRGRRRRRSARHELGPRRRRSSPGRRSSSRWARGGRTSTSASGSAPTRCSAPRRPRSGRRPGPAVTLTGTRSRRWTSGTTSSSTGTCR